VPREFALPDDLRFFYESCGGAELFVASGFMIRIVSPEELILTNTVIFGGMALEAEIWEELERHKSRSWYRVAQGDGESQYVSIDLALKCPGTCYDSHWVNHPGNSKIIAYSFTEFLYRTIMGRGKAYYW
jgi:antitoxin YokJ